MREMWKNRRSTNPSVYLALFFIGMLAGIVFVHAQRESAYAGIFSEYFLNQYASLKIDYRKLFKYVGSYRCGQYILLTCCGALPAAPVIFSILVFFFGMTWGTMISISTIRLGLKGVMICTVGMIPQIFFYIPAFGWLLLWVWQRRYSRKKYMFLTFAGFFFLLFGIVTEVYLNPLILQQILRKM